MKREDSRTGGEEGLTLVEMLVTVLLLAMVILGSASLLSQVLNQSKLAQKRSVATYLTAERIDQITSLRYRVATDYAEYSLPGETVAAGPPITFTADYGSIPDYPEYRRVVTLNYDVPVAGMLEVVARTSWQDFKQGEKTHELITYIHPGLEQRQ